MNTCAACGVESPDAFRFCPGCGSPLTAAAPAASREERRVVTVLFSDLAGFTSRSEALDPEDARALLVPYYAILEEEITGHGGVVERHIGDGIMALFGAPVAHEDDPERAIRAALRILDRISALGLDLHARIGINTGDILFRSEGTGREDAVTGDAANTAARLQGLAPIDSVVVGEITWRATNRLFDYVEHPTSVVKGKAEPIRVFQPTAARGRLGIDLTRTHDTPHVGRERETATITAAFDAAVASRSVRLVTVVGEPGMGKSRLVGELLAHAQARTPGLTWRQGRCLPYGDGVTFWALGEIVKAQAGILETDDLATATTKIADAVPAGVDRDWLRQRLLPLLGMDAASGAERDELFAAWGSFLASMAETNPTVLVFEDLHWADAAMLAFLEHLARSTAQVPLLVLATARPQLFERHPDQGRAHPNGIRIDLAPLSESETSALVAGLLGAVVPDELVAPIIERAEGNPLYAEEFVRLLKDRDLLIEANGVAALKSGSTLPLPESITALLAARLDMLSAADRALLADAAVVGKVFWAGALAAMGDRFLGDVETALAELASKELVRVAPRSSMAAETEYAFWHVLARDVAYSQLPRASRAAKHAGAATWLEQKAGERVEDIAEVLAHHWATALELTRSVGQTDRAATLEPKAIRFLTLAGAKAGRLDIATAAASYERALALAPAGHAARPTILFRLAEAFADLGRGREAVALGDEAIAALRASGDLPTALDAMGIVSSCLLEFADPRAWAINAERLALAETLPPSRQTAKALVSGASAETMLGRPEKALELVDHAIRISEQLDLPRPYLALANRGWARCQLWDPGGIDEMREAIALGTAAEDGAFVVYWQNNIAVFQLPFEGPRPALATLRTAMDMARTRRIGRAVDVIRGSTALILFCLAEFDEALGLVADLRASESTLALAEAESYEALILVARGQVDRIAARLEWIETTVRNAGDMEYLVVGAGSSAVARASLGQAREARALLAELASNSATRRQLTYATFLPGLVRAAIAIGDAGLARQLVAGVEPDYPYAVHALAVVGAALAEADGDLAAALEAYRDAAKRWESFGVPYERALALLAQGRCLVGLGRGAEAGPVLREAREILGRLEAAPALAEIEALQAEVAAPAG